MYRKHAANSFDARKLKWGMTIQLKQYISLDDMTLSSLWKKKKIVFIIKQFIPVPEIQETFRHFWFFHGFTQIRKGSHIINVWELNCNHRRYSLFLRGVWGLQRFDDGLPVVSYTVESRLPDTIKRREPLEKNLMVFRYLTASPGSCIFRRINLLKM